MAELDVNEENWKKMIDDEHLYSVDAGERPSSASPACSIEPWISISDRLPPENEKVFFWLVAKEPHECPHDSNGNAITIFGKHEPHWYFCKWQCWSSLEKPTHWRPNFTPPEQ